MKIGVIGGGVVGHATACAFREHVDEVRVYDTVAERRSHDVLKTLQTDIVFICLPTPANDTTLILDKFLSSLKGEGDGTKWDFTAQNFVLRSTVPIGYTRKARKRFNLPNLVHSPEFLTARTAVEDAANPTRLVIGGAWDGAPGSNATYILDHLYRDRWPTVPVFRVSSDESETVKLAQNAFSAVKIGFFNELHQLCAKTNQSYETVLQALLAGGWVNPMHTQVPGPDGKRGFGGACLPKDLANLCHCFGVADVSNPVTYAAQFWARDDK